MTNNYQVTVMHVTGYERYNTFDFLSATPLEVTDIIVQSKDPDDVIAFLETANVNIRCDDVVIIDGTWYKLDFTVDMSKGMDEDGNWYCEYEILTEIDPSILDSYGYVDTTPELLAGVSASEFIVEEHKHYDALSEIFDEDTEIRHGAYATYTWSDDAEENDLNEEPAPTSTDVLNAIKAVVASAKAVVKEPVVAPVVTVEESAPIVAAVKENKIIIEHKNNLDIDPTRVFKTVTFPFMLLQTGNELLCKLQGAFVNHTVAYGVEKVKQHLNSYVPVLVSSTSAVSQDDACEKVFALGNSGIDGITLNHSVSVGDIVVLTTPNKAIRAYVCVESGFEEINAIPVMASLEKRAGKKVKK